MFGGIGSAFGSYFGGADLEDRFDEAIEFGWKPWVERLPR